MAFELDSGKTVWARQLGGYDVFYFACLVPGNPDCPPGPNLDADFGEAPLLVTAFVKGRMVDVVVAVQKSGFAWALDRDNGDIIWFNVSIWVAHLYHNALSAAQGCTIYCVSTFLYFEILIMSCS